MARSVMFICHISSGAKSLQNLTWVVAALSIDWAVAQIVDGGALALGVVLLLVDDRLDEVERDQVFLREDVVLFAVVLG